MSTWEFIRYLHLVAMAFFVGGQLVLVAAVVPATRALPDKTTIRAIARRFGVGSLVAVVVLIVTGSLMAEHYSLWGSSDLQIKLGLVVLTALLIVWHMRKPTLHAIEGVVFILSLAIVWLGVAISHY